MLRRILVVLAWAVGGIVGLCVVLYLIAVAINWRDAEPSEEVLGMADQYRNRPAVRDEDNAFIFVMGFNVAPDESPLGMGLKRVAWLRQHEGTTALDLSTDPLGERPNHRATMHPALRAYFESCGPGAAGCATALSEASRTFDEWKSSEEWLLERYQSLINLPGWREDVPRDIASPLPPYQLVMDGQKVLFLHARNRATDGDAAGVRELLSVDLRFWRRLLGSSDLLISKMIATAAINRHFKLGADVLRQLPPQQAPGALPAEWQVAITDAERSAQRWMIGEWIFMCNVLRDLEHGMADAFPTEDSIAGKLLAKLGGPLFQPQDTINLYADYFLHAVELLEGVPLSGYEAAANRVTEMSTIATRDSWSSRSLYNIPGRMLVGYGADYGSYVRRVGDIEGVRRAALAAVELHVAQTASGAVPAALAASPLRNPYTDVPFEWDATEGTVVFRGLEPGERGEHRIH
jgi:hypothetical protein